VDRARGGQARQRIVFKKQTQKGPAPSKEELEVEGGSRSEEKPEGKLQPGVSSQWSAGEGKGKQKASGEPKQKEERKAGDEQIIKIHLAGCRAPPTATAKGKELEWKKTLRSRVEAAIKKADPGPQSSVLGTSYHFSRRNERVVTV